LGLLLLISLEFVVLYLPRVEELVVLILVEPGQLVLETLVYHLVYPTILG